MNIIAVSQKEYAEVITSVYHVFNSAIFNELNNDKCEDIYYLLFKDTKIRLGLILGKKGHVAYSPFSAPFGGFSFCNEDISIEKINESIQALNVYLKENEFDSIKMILPSLCYNKSFVSKLINSLSRNGYKISHIDLNHVFYTSLADENYIEQILHRNARKNLKIALKQNLIFQKTKDIGLVYNIIKRNREARGFPLKMTLEQVKDTINIIKWDAFVVQSNDDIIASALVFYVADSIVQVIYWGDILDFALMKTMNFLAYNIFNYYAERKIMIIDIGPSTKNGIPNLGLCKFKESIGCLVEPKFTFEKYFLYETEH